MFDEDEKGFITIVDVQRVLEVRHIFFHCQSSLVEGYKINIGSYFSQVIFLEFERSSHISRKLRVNFSLTPFSLCSSA